MKKIRRLLDSARKKRLASLRGDTKGSVAIIFGLSVLMLTIAAGTAVDVARAYLVKQRLSFALDAAGLAVGAAVGGGEDLQTVANNIFNANFPSTALGTPTTPTLNVTSSLITISASATVNTAFMRIVNVNSITVNAAAEITRETTGLEMVMVLDNTGSMNSYGRLTSLKSASHDLINILFGDDATPATLKVGMVPFSGSVNIGSSSTAYVTNPAAYNWGTTSWGGCVEARPYPYDVQDASTAVGGPWTPLYWADNNYYNNWDRGSYYRIDASPPSYRGPNKECPREVTPLTNNKATLESEIDAMWASGYTHINYGAVWGWRLLSPDAPFTEGVAYGDPDWNKAIIILTDGSNTTSNSHYTAYGYRSEGRLGSTSSWGTTTELNNRLSTVCTNIKNTGIIVYTITFQVSSSSTQTLFSNCASDPSKYFNSPDSATLTASFRAIGAELRKLHLSE